MSLTDSTPIKLPVKIWLATLGTAALAGGAWFSLKADTAGNTAEITSLKADNHEIRQEQREMREILIRVDENVKQLRRDNRDRP